jgi:hypothetical protein
MPYQSPRPRAADDFATIRSRMEELRRERAEASADAGQARSVNGPRPYAVSSRSSRANSVVFPPAIMRRRLLRR